MRVYLDHAATTAVFSDVVREVGKIFVSTFGNASSSHSHGEEAKKVYEDSRKVIAQFINCSPDELIFTSGGTESDNLAIIGFLRANFPNGGHIITTKIEHPAVLEVAKYLEKNGYEVTYLSPTPDGYVLPDDLRKAIRKNTVIVSVMWVNNETGVIQPIEEISSICREHGIVFHSDAVQAIGKIRVDARILDMLSASGHKFYAPKGSGFLYIKNSTKVEPIIFGGGHEKGLRSGTENVPGAVGMATALKVIDRNFEVWNDKVKKLRKMIIDAIETIPNHHINGTSTIPTHVNVSFKGIHGEALATALDMHGISVSTASACSSHHGTKRSHVLEAMQLEDWMIDGAVRISLGYDNTEEEIAYFVSVLEQEVHRLRKLER